EEALRVIKCLNMGDSAKVEELIQELFGEIELGVRFDEEEETNSMLLQHAYFEKEKGKMVYIVDDAEVENMDVDHSNEMPEFLDIVDKNKCTYHKPMKTKKVIIGMNIKPKEAIIGDYWFDYEVAKIIELL
ncbi:hypothetical protein KI387_008960, partial [Taxus chinensis]